jgi:hypothetical protein
MRSTDAAACLVSFTSEIFRKKPEGQDPETQYVICAKRVLSDPLT